MGNELGRLHASCGSIVMAHGDEKGLRLPPRLAPIQAVLVPIYRNDAERTAVMTQAHIIETALKGFRVKVDDRPKFKPGYKYHEWEQAGVPLRIEIGPRDVAKGQSVLVRRDTGEKTSVATPGITDTVDTKLGDVQQGLLDQAYAFRKEHTHLIDHFDEFRERVEEGFLLAHWCGSPRCEASVQEETRATIRCVPFDQVREKDLCIHCGGNSEGRVLFARAY